MNRPDFLIIGAMRSGTTSLCHYLGQHPEIFVSGVKEPGFFAFESARPDYSGPGDDALNAVTSLDEYSSLFASAQPNQLACEASTLYLCSDTARDRICSHIPQAKLLAILSSPAERTWSHYMFMRRQGLAQTTDLPQAMALEEMRMAESWDPRWFYFERSLYGKQLEPYFTDFSASQIHILLLEDLIAQPQPTLRGFLPIRSSEERCRARSSERGRT